jgi:hypothetical protein
MSDDLTEAPNNKFEMVEMGKLRIQIEEGESRLLDARNNIKGAEIEIEKIKNILAGWERFHAYQRKRAAVLEYRIKGDREQLRMEEDYASGVGS